MSSRQVNQQIAYQAYLTKWGLNQYEFVVPAAGQYDTLFVFPKGIEKSNFNTIRSVDTLVRAAKRSKTVRLWVGKDGVDIWSRDRFQDFETWDAFREYCMIVRLTGL